MSMTWGGRRDMAVGAALHQAPAPAGLGRPRGPHRADPAPAERAATTPARQPRHRPAVAPPPGHQEADLFEPDGTAAGQRRDRRAHRAAPHRWARGGGPGRRWRWYVGL